MTTDSLWELFILTGLPEVYTLFRCTLAEEEQAIDQKTA